MRMRKINFSRFYGSDIKNAYRGSEPIDYILLHEIAAEDIGCLKCGGDNFVWDCVRQDGCIEFTCRECGCVAKLEWHVKWSQK